ncbi:response regulator transcription factor [Aridibaculum aurantiacum]|uniref:response regulator transcription factor n=1 Tax=Aridibaculum aurantiacum TaxID=2810307 RepID=UPI001A9783F3|nr:response regulator [Aridibaculum aurantiacum]
MKILIAEDDSLILRMMELCLKKEGHDVICSKDGRDAVEKIKAQNPDLIIVDIMMPYISGLEIVGMVKQQIQPVPVIVLSAMGQQGVVDEAVKLGADHYISKPFNIQQLSSHINRLTSPAIAS